MKRLRLIACDLDRTLLREDKTLSPYTLSVLERCRALGILFVPATARPPRTLEGLIPSLTYDGALCHNGGVALFGGKIMWEQGIASDLAARLLLQFQEEFPGTTISAEMGGELYANFPAETIWKDIAYHRSDFSNLPGCPAEKLILGLTAPEQVQRVEALLPPELYAQVAENTILTIQPRGIRARVFLPSVKSFPFPRRKPSALETIGTISPCFRQAAPALRWKTPCRR